MKPPVQPGETAVQAAPRTLPAMGARPPSVVGALPARGLRGLLRGAVVPYLSRQVHGVGQAGAAGVALLVFAVTFFFGAAAPLRGELADLQSTLDGAQGSQPRTRPTVATPQAELKDFVTRLPQRRELPALTAQIVTLAQSAGLSLDRGTYDSSTTRSGQLVRARMAFPVHGRYPDIRRFIDTTLATIPGAAVDALRFERKQIGDAEIDADIRFAIYLRGGP